MEKVYPDVAVRYELARSLAEFVTHRDADLEREEFLKKIGERIRRSLIQTVTNGVTIRPIFQPFSGGRDGKLSDTIDRKSIQTALGSGIEHLNDAWFFNANNEDCGIWAHRNIRWSYCGPKEIFESLFGAENVTPD